MAENKDNNITSVMEALVKGAESVFTTKTVVGEATKIDDTIIIPLVDVSFGIGAGASCGAVSYTHLIAIPDSACFQAFWAEEAETGDAVRSHADSPMRCLDRKQEGAGWAEKVSKNLRRIR